MEFRIADTFTASLGRLAAAEQRAAKTTVYDIQVDPSAHGLRLHRVDQSKDANFWTARVNDDIRIVLHRTQTSVLLCYVGHHDDAYAWAERRRIETHPHTGAAQLVELVVRAEQASGPPRAPSLPEVQQRPAPRKPFMAIVADQLLAYGIPPDWIATVQAADEESVFDLVAHLPAEAMDALLELATGGRPALPVPAPPDADPFAHPDAQRRFRVVANLDELKQALEYPWEKWAVFLHPAQRELVERRFGGPARVTGSAGTGKTVVALHRAVHLARQSPDARVLLATFSKSLRQALKIKLGHLIGPADPAAARITVAYVDGIAHQLHEQALGVVPNIAMPAQIDAALKAAAEEPGERRFTQRFLAAEWRQVVDAWQLRSWEAYRDVTRLGRKTRIGGSQREALWGLFQRAQAYLHARNLVTWAETVARVTDHYSGAAAKPFTHAVIDEAQDISIPQLRLLAAIVPAGVDSLFFAGDIGQRIFQPPFSWLSQGVDVRGRSSSLKVNYRTSHQIRRRADLLLPAHVRDVDGYEEGRRGTISVFDGPEPDVGLFGTVEDEVAFVGAWIGGLVTDGTAPHEIAVLVRSTDQFDRAKAAIKAAGQKWVSLYERPG
ncbi:MAG: ATP-dependent helicase [Rhodospirillales bacterium]|nr:ATP-dependent helicase [Rhodospirillales bacterium]